MLTPKEEFIVKGIYNEWLEKSVDLINDSFGLSFPDQTRIKLNFVRDNNLDYAVKSNYSGINDYIDCEINVNMSKWTNIDENDVNGSGFDNTFAHELTHSVMKANISNYNTLPGWFIEGAAELVIGGDDRYSEIRTLLKGGAASLKAKYNRGNVSTSSTDYAENSALGFMLLRYYAKETSRYTHDTPVEVIQNLMGYLKENNSLIGAINFTSLGKFKNTQSLIDSFKELIEEAK